MRGSIIVAVLSILLVAAILIWRGAAPVAVVGLSNVVATPVMGEPGVVDVTMTIETSEEPDVLMAVTSPAAQEAQIVSPQGQDKLTLPARGAPALSLDGSFIRLAGVDGDISDGRLIPLTLTFLRSGEQSVRARVATEADPHAKHRAMAAMAETAQDGPAPRLRLALKPAANGATLVRLEVENFTFAPDSETPEHVPGHGHGHLYLDGVKLQRMYGNEALVGALPAGTYQLSVELNTNLHVPYVDADGPVRAEAELVIK